ncbi:FAD-binding and (Fe-S)-binding domain-containing protein [Pragia fontium]|uniref:FAD-binding and (Fe-S)-binding domain-containing protein n=1 Tax=Pragia fontium TaxID=82985 RepID=UPI000E0723DE|nr:FAD-binding and (Fe-S)-binding domain-containing protein [Pragia fontium]SUB81102.1 glycolate oxidase subunit GlcD [Pragia fontium]VEJ53049.1 glycolate oxidase subunit GlcD [Pragia fontium]
MKASYQTFYRELCRFVPKECIYTDPSRTMAYGTDASCYRLIPQIVVRLDSEKQVQQTLVLAQKHGHPVTFRAAGTSLSGQAITDSILITLGDNWRQYKIFADAGYISLKPGVIGADANRYLAPFGRKIGPDPASIDACKIGGIAANNASGMCCGTAQNSYQTLQAMRLILADGTLIDTADSESVSAFKKNHNAMLEQLQTLSQQTKNNHHLAELIRHKYRLKNTTGYSLNALVDFDDPLDILTHLMIGSEGTLGFIAEITYQTVEEHQFKASALFVFSDIEAACEATRILKQQPVSAVELMDRGALASVENESGLPDFMPNLSEDATALLVEVRSADAEGLKEKMAQIMSSISTFTLEQQVPFTDKPEEFGRLWAIRKGIFPAIGAVRPVGSTVIIEDVAFPIEQLAAGVRDLRKLFIKHDYNAVIYGHALDGNMHFVFQQSFDSPEQVRRYQVFMEDIAQLVAVEYKGSLKAEHGTGRNMASFVELEWGSEAYELMWQLKNLLDPHHLLSPGVLLNRDHQAHLQNLKLLPAADKRVDSCIECGFCEPVCPSTNLSFTPRQRIVIWREINRLRRSGDDNQRLKQLEKDFRYLGDDTCAATGLCARRCPVGINTGELIRDIRTQRNMRYERVARWTADHFTTLTTGARLALNTVAGAGKVVGRERLGKITKALHVTSAGHIPLLTPSFPKGAHSPTAPKLVAGDLKVVYLPSCASRTMGASANDDDQRPLTEIVEKLLNKAGFSIIYPEKLDSLCCGMPYNSKGITTVAQNKLGDMEQALWEASEQGKYPILIDTSPCALRAVEGFTKPMALFEPVGFVNHYLADKLHFTPEDKPIMMHVTCSSVKMGLSAAMKNLLDRCCTQVIIPDGIHCCGFAGDKGIKTPELNSNALRLLSQQVPANCSEGVSNSRTCEIGLTEHSGVPYRSILYVVDRVTTPLS